MLVTELAEKFFAYVEARNKPRTLAYYRSIIARWIAAVGPVDVAELRKHHLLSWGRSWHQLQAVQRLFQWAHVEMELIDRNPFSKVKRPRPGGRRRVLSRAQLLQVLRASDKNFRPFLLAMRETIARPQEIRQATWESVKWEGPHQTAAAAIAAGDASIELHDYKSRERRADPEAPRVLFISARLGRLLLRLAGRSTILSGPIFRNSRARAWSSNAVRLRVRRLRDKVKLAADSRGEKIVAYSIRHTQATAASVNGVPDRVLAEVMGHTSTRTTARYQHVSKNHLRDALKRLWKK